MSVLGEEQGLKPSFFDQASQFAWAHRVMSWEACHSNVHAGVLPDAAWT